MDLQIKIIKNYHETKQDFRNIKHHLESARVISIEQVIASESDARQIEGSISAAIRMNLSAEQFMQQYKEVLNPNGYQKELWGYIFRKRLPVILAERFPDDQYQKMSEIKKKANNSPDIYLFAPFDETVKAAWDHIKYYNSYQSMRDENIAENVKETVPARIRMLYPHLDGTAQYSMLIGREHYPEKYMPAQVVDCELDCERDDLTPLIRLADIHREGGTWKDGINLIAREYLEAAVFLLLMNDLKRIQVTQSLRTLNTSYEDVKSYADTIVQLGNIRKREHQSETAKYLISHGVPQIEGRNLEVFLDG
jgi:hypothetical protein